MHQWVTQGTKGSINNAQRPGRGSMMLPTINEESDCLRGKNLRRRRQGKRLLSLSRVGGGGMEGHFAAGPQDPKATKAPTIS